MTMIAESRRHPRSPDRMPDSVWEATLNRIRGEFDEMPCLRLTVEQACALFGLQQPASSWIMDRLAAEGFLVRTPQGEYVRRKETP